MWGINIAFLIHGKSLPASLTVGGPGISYTCDLPSGTARVNNRFELLGSRLICSQFHSVWDPKASLCVVTNSDITKLNILITLATDVMLLLMVFAGLLRLRLGGGSMFDLGSFLWKQVGGGIFL
jgi:hypothetical protein